MGLFLCGEVKVKFLGHDVRGGKGTLPLPGVDATLLLITVM